MKQNKIVIILASVIMVLSLCIASKEVSIQYILADMYYGNENSQSDIIFSRSSGLAFFAISRILLTCLADLFN